MMTVRLFGVLLSAFLLVSGCGKPTKQEVLPKDVTDFESLYRPNCSGCHGENGKQGAGPQLNYPLYLAFIPKETLRQTIEKGRPGSLMPAFAVSEGGSLYPPQIDALVNGIEQRWGKPADFQNANFPPYSESGGDAAHGKQVFQIACFACHNPRGVGGSINNKTYLGVATDQSIRTTIVVGKPLLGMLDWRHRPFGHVLNNQEITDVVAYLSSLG